MKFDFHIFFIIIIYVYDLIKSLILLHSSWYFLFSSLLSLVGTNVKYLVLLISWKNPFGLLKIRYKGLTLLVFTYFKSLIVTYSFNVVYENISVWLFVYFDIFWIKIFYVDNIIEKVVCSVFYDHIFDYITHFYNAFIDIKLLWIHYLYYEMVINVFFLCSIFYQITVNTNSHQQRCSS